MTNVVFKSACAQSISNLKDHLALRLLQMTNNMGMDYVENLQMTIVMNNGEEFKVVPTFLSPAGFTGFDYGTADDMDNAIEFNQDEFIEDAETMAAILVECIRSREGFSIIEVTGDVEDEDVCIAQSLS